MRKCSLLIASCFLFGTQLCADPIQTITISSLTGSTNGSLNVTFVTFSGSGPLGSFELAPMTKGECSVCGGATSGMPIGPASFGVSSPSGDEGLLTIGGTQRPVLLEGSVFAFGGTNLLVPDTATSVTFPGTAKVDFAAFACGTHQFSPPCTGPQIANIVGDLPGLLTINYDGSLGFRANFAGSLAFVSIPEPSSMFLSLFGAATLALGLIARRRKSPN
jgi:PEP-CTERM motif